MQKVKPQESTTIKGIGLLQWKIYPLETSKSLFKAIQKQTSEEFIVKIHKLKPKFDQIELNKQLNGLDPYLKEITAFPQFYSMKSQGGETKLYLFYNKLINHITKTLEEDINFRTNKDKPIGIEAVNQIIKSEQELKLKSMKELEKQQQIQNQVIEIKDPLNNNNNQDNKENENINNKINIDLANPQQPQEPEQQQQQNLDKKEDDQTQNQKDIENQQDTKPTTDHKPIENQGEQQIIQKSEEKQDQPLKPNSDQKDQENQQQNTSIFQKICGGCIKCFSSSSENPPADTNKNEEINKNKESLLENTKSGHIHHHHHHHHHSSLIINKEEEGKKKAKEEEEKIDSTKQEIQHYEKQQYEDLAISASYIFEKILEIQENDQMSPITCQDLKNKYIFVTENFQIKLDIGSIFIEQQYQKLGISDEPKDSFQMDAEMFIIQERELQQMEQNEKEGEKDPLLQKANQNPNNKEIQKDLDLMQKIVNNDGKLPEEKLFVKRPIWDLNQKEKGQELNLESVLSFKRYSCMLIQLGTLKSEVIIIKSHNKENFKEKLFIQNHLLQFYNSVYVEFLYKIAEKDQTEYRNFSQIRKILDRSINPDTTNIWDKRFTFIMSSILFYLVVISDILVAIDLLSNNGQIYALLLFAFIFIDRVYLTFQSQYEDRIRYSSLCFFDQIGQYFSVDYGNERKQIYNQFQQIIFGTIPSQIITMFAYFDIYYKNPPGLVHFSIVMSLLFNSWVFLNYYKLKYKYEQIIQKRNMKWNKQLLGPIQLPLKKETVFEKAMGQQEEKNETFVKGMINNCCFEYEKEILKLDIENLPIKLQVYIFITALVENSAKIFGFGLMTALNRPWMFIGYVLIISLIFSPKIFGFFKNVDNILMINTVQNYLRNIYVFKQNHGGMHESIQHLIDKRTIKRLKIEDAINKYQLLTKYPRILLQNDDIVLSEDEILELFVGNYMEYQILDRGDLFNTDDDLYGFKWLDLGSAFSFKKNTDQPVDQNLDSNQNQYEGFINPKNFKKEISMMCKDSKDGKKGITVKNLRKLFKLQDQSADHYYKALVENSERSYYIDMASLIQKGEQVDSSAAEIKSKQESSMACCTVCCFPCLAPPVLYMYIGYLRFEEIVFLEQFRDGPLKAWQIPSLYAISYRALELIFFGICALILIKKDQSYESLLNLYMACAFIAEAFYMLFIFEKKFRDL